MQKKVKHTIIGYLEFFYQIVGHKLTYNILLGLLVSFLDGVGLAMFMPLLQFANDGNKESSAKSMGALHYLLDLFNWLSVPINIYTILALMVIVFVIKAVVNFWQLSSQIILKQFFIKKIRYELKSNLEKLKYVHFLKFDAGKIQNNLTAEVSTLTNGVIQYLATMRNATMLLAYIVLAFMANWQFAFMVAAGALLSNVLFKKMYNAVKEDSIAVSKQGHSFNSVLIQTVHYFKYLKATNSIEKFSSKLKNVIDTTEDLNTRIGVNQALTTSIREPLVMVIVALVISLQVRFLGSTLGSIILSILLFYRALTYLMTLQSSWQGFAQNVGAIDSISSLNTEMYSAQEDFTGKAVVTEIKDLRISDVTFYYGENLILQNISAEIPLNKTIALVGESGSGKTTLANIIIGLLEPTEGEVLVNSIPVKEINLEGYRQKIGYISQEPVIFNDNIFNNITFWAEPTPENVEKFWRVIEQASLKGFIENLPGRENTMLGDHGMLISGGQRQRISIARELFKDVSILMMDEATSALDSETERFIQDSIDALHGSYTMIIIAHRLSTIKSADKIYVLEKGRVVNDGTFSELVNNSPKFKRMVALQEV